MRSQPPFPRLLALGSWPLAVGPWPYPLGPTLLALCSALLAAGAVAAAPIHFSKLIEHLPGEDAIAGFARKKPEGSTTAAMGFHSTVVAASYENRQDESQTIRIQLSDGVPTQVVTMAYSALAKFSQESTDGYEKGVQIDGFQGIERFTHAGQEGLLTMVVGSVLVEIRTNGLPAEMLRTIWKQIPTAAIQAAKPAPE